MSKKNAWVGKCQTEEGITIEEQLRKTLKKEWTGLCKVVIKTS